MDNVCVIILPVFALFFNLFHIFIPPIPPVQTVEKKPFYIVADLLASMPFR